MAQRLTAKQNMFIANVIKGMSGTKAAMKAYNLTNTNMAAVIASRNIRNDKILEALQPYYEKHDICLDRALDPIGKALKANVQIVTDKKIIDTDVPDLDTRLKGSDRALKLLRMV